MTDKKRDESRDCFVVTRFGKPLRVYGIETQVIDSPDGSEDCGHYVPHYDLVESKTVAKRAVKLLNMIDRGHPDVADFIATLPAEYFE